MKIKCQLIEIYFNHFVITMNGFTKGMTTISISGAIVIVNVFFVSNLYRNVDR